MPRKIRKTFVISIGFILISLMISACTGSGTGASAGSSFTLAPLKDMPKEVQRAPLTVQQAYQFAVANPELLSQIPCYCGCGGMGHGSNYACYVQGMDTGGGIAFDGHALGCSICVDITQDTMRLLEQGQTLPEIQAYVDQTYARFGPSNMP